MRAVASGSHFRTCHIWFEEFGSISALEKLKNECGNYDCIIIHGNQIPFDINGTISFKQESIVNDLTQPDLQLLNLTSKTVRNEINRAEREKVETVFYSADDLKTDYSIVESFSSMYHNMYNQKGIKGQELPVKELAGYIDSNQLLISTAKLEGKPVVFHSYIYGEGNSRLLHSCSEFRGSGNDIRNAIGRANKYLHWKDYQKLKELNVRRYDWGGISSLAEPNGIDKFKLSFGGGSPVVYYNVTVPLTLKYRLYSTVSRLLPQ